jgi:sodium/proline symporter
MYEIVPGFIANIVTIFILNHFFPVNNPEIEEEFDYVVSQVKHHVFQGPHK